MSASSNRRRFLYLLIVPTTLGCATSQSWLSGTRHKRPLRRPPPENFPAHEIRYSDSDGFDLMLETALTSKRPSIVIETGATSPDEIDPRVQTWVSAWMDGGEVDLPNSKGLGAAQAIMLGLEIANSAQFDQFMSNAKDKAAQVATWYNDRKTREKRVELLKPYLLAFENSEKGGSIKIRLYNGQYSSFDVSDDERTGSM